MKKINEMTSRELDQLVRRSVKKEIDDAKKNGQPIAKYDMKKRMAYREYPDGRKVYDF